MWRFIAPRYEDRYRVVLFDLVGSGNSDLASYDKSKYASLQGYADDALEVIAKTAKGWVIFVGHSVSAMMGMLAELTAPGATCAQIMVCPSACYVNQGDYIGGPRYVH